jgi:putative ABC transport system permease protein
MALIVDKQNRVDTRILDRFGVAVKDTYTFGELIGRELRVIANNDYYTEGAGGLFEADAGLGNLYENESALTLRIVGVMRVKESSSSEFLNAGFGYTAALTEYMLGLEQGSDIAAAQTASKTVNVITGNAFTATNTYSAAAKAIGADVMPTGVSIYPKTFDDKEAIKVYLDAYNKSRDETEQIIYSDIAETISGAISTMLNTVTVVLAAFAAISLVVSSIMIGIITYVSVVERTKEIGILRSLGARKKDISRVFNAETLLIGFVAGTFGILVTLLLSIPINLIVAGLVGVSGIAALPVWYAIGLILISMLLSLIAGLVPSRIASKKDPVVALRTE